MNNDVLEQWNELKVLVEHNESDVLKNANGNASAGVRARHGLRALAKKCNALVKATLESDKQVKAQKKS